jgi:hypothetical protein
MSERDRLHEIINTLPPQPVHALLTLLRIGKRRVFFSLDQPGNIVVTDVDNRGQAY